MHYICYETVSEGDDGMGGMGDDIVYCLVGSGTTRSPKLAEYSNCATPPSAISFPFTAEQERIKGNWSQKEMLCLAQLYQEHKSVTLGWR